MTIDSFGRVIANSGMCPDCNADVQLIEVEPRVKRLTVLHDDTCPTLRAIEDRGRAA